MPPPRQNANVTKDCIFYKILRYCGSKAVGSPGNFLCKTKVSDGTATLPKRTYSPINLFSYSPHKKAAFTLAKGDTHVAHFVDVRRVAFTLAEVLITLGIIGIVAAMTMPSLITNYQKQRAVTQLKKSYTNLAEAVKRSELENDTVANWNFAQTGKNFFDNYLSNFINVSNSNISKANIEYKYLNGSDCAENLCTTDSYIVYLTDGSSLIISRNLSSNGKVISIDINGNKRPNIVGKDFFSFAITQNDGVVPFGYGNFSWPDLNQNFGDYDRDKITGTDSYACNKDKRGFWCTALIIMDGWTISKDYPW